MKNLLVSFVFVGVLCMPFAASAQVLPGDVVTQAQLTAQVDALRQEIISLLQQLIAIKIAELQAQIDGLATTTPPATGGGGGNTGGGSGGGNPASDTPPASPACDDTPIITYQAWEHSLAPVQVTQPYVVAVNEDLYFNVFVHSACDHAWTIDVNYGAHTFRDNAPSPSSAYLDTLPGSFVSGVPIVGSVVFTARHGNTEASTSVDVTVQ